MSLTASEMTPADIAAVTGGGGRGGDGMFGDGAWWIIVLFLFAGWGRGGLGGGGYGGGYSGGCGGGSACATQADLAAGFNNSAVLSSLNDIKMGQAQMVNYTNQGFSGLNTALLQGFNGVERGFCDVSRQIAECCCGTQRAIDGVNYNMAKGFCDLGNVVQNTTRDVIDNQNANSRAILDALNQNYIRSIERENESLRLRASQSDQNAVIGARIDAAVAEVLRRTGTECPVPAYVVNGPTPVTFPTNCCGQVQYAGSGCNSGCGGF